MKEEQIIYFYYSTIIPCQKGKILEEFDDKYEIARLNSMDRRCGTITIPKNRVFDFEQECLNYAQSIEDEKRIGLKSALTTKEDVLKYMYDSIWRDDYDFVTEKDVLKEKIYELFNIKID